MGKGYREMDKRQDGRGFARYVRPKNAEKKFKVARELGQTLYLYGVTGCGKTALVRDMLRPGSYDYRSAAETGAQELGAARARILVVDDLQEVRGRGRREDYAKALRALSARRDVWLILISRCRIPQWLMPLNLESAFLTIDEADLLLDRPGQDAFFERWNLSLPPEAADRVWALAHGNPLFLRLTALAGGDVRQAVSDLWSYLFQVYDQWDPELQEFAMEMAVVGRFDARMAQMVTGRSDVQRLIKKAAEAGNFLRERDGLYEFNFILSGDLDAYLRRKFDREQVSRIYYDAGRMYEMCGDLPNALRMHELGGDEASIFRLLVANARQNPAGGYYFELRRYYLMLPKETISTSPVLMAGMSMLESMLLNVEESERWYRRLEEFAQNSSGSARREAASRLLYLDLSLPHRGTVRMTDLLRQAETLLRDKEVLLPELSVTSNLPSLMNGGKDFCEWSRRDKELAAGIGAVAQFVLGKYGKGLVPIALAESGFEKGVNAYEIVSLAEKGRMQAEAGGKTELVFVAVGILVWLSILNGRADDAQDILEGFRQSVEREAPQLLPNLCALRCRIDLYQGKLPRISDWLSDAPNENRDFCTLERLRYLTKIRCYIQFGKYEKAYGLLQKMAYYARVQQRGYIAMETRLLLAVVMYRMKEPGWQEPLQEAVTQAEDYHFVRLISREGGAVLRLLKKGDIRWKDDGFRRQVIRECEQMEKYYPSYLKEKTEGALALSGNALNILRLQAEGYQTEEIARLLGISANTIKYHCKETYRKLGVSSKAAAVSEAKNRGLI